MRSHPPLWVAAPIIECQATSAGYEARPLRKLAKYHTLSIAYEVPSCSHKIMTKNSVVFLEP